MTRKPSLICAWLLALTLAFPLGIAAATPQHPAASPAAQQPAQGEHRTEGSGNQSELVEASEAAAHEEGDHEAQFKYSGSVRWIAKLTGLSKEAVYWILIAVNFAVIGGAIAYGLKRFLPGYFRRRTEQIQGAMAEARRASEAAGRRLADIEMRLSRLDAEIVALHAAADAEAAAEEQRVHAAAHEEGRKIAATAEQEIAASVVQARRQLKAYAAELAVSLAAQRIQVSPSADSALVRDFTRQMEKDGNA